jgi:hypothetical protein
MSKMCRSCAEADDVTSIMNPRAYAIRRYLNVRRAYCPSLSMDEAQGGLQHVWPLSWISLGCPKCGRSGVSDAWAIKVRSPHPTLFPGPSSLRLRRSV